MRNVPRDNHVCNNKSIIQPYSQFDLINELPNNRKVVMVYLKGQSLDKLGTIRWLRSTHNTGGFIFNRSVCLR